jgi:glycosyltransferase involved in cell wall biosynthesis
VAEASVVVPTFNRARLLPEVLQALLRQDYGDGFEILVVDDGSRDATPQVLSEWSRLYPSRIRVFRQENAGPARARNRGVEEARGWFVAFIDDDCLPEGSWLSGLRHALQGTAAAAGAVVNRTDGWVGRYINLESVVNHVVSSDGSVAEPITGNFAVRTDVFRALGGFDEAIRVAGGEDTEFGLRLRAAGHTIVLAPLARVRHESRTGPVDYLRMIFRHGRGRRRLGERVSEFRLNVPVLRLLWLLWPVRTWMGRDYSRYRRGGVSRGEAMAYVALRYLENPVRMAGYIRGSR